MDESDAKIFLGVRDTDVQTISRMRIYVVRAFDSTQRPSGLLQFSDQVGTAHGVYHTHAAFGEQLPLGVEMGSECNGTTL